MNSKGQETTSYELFHTCKEVYWDLLKYDSEQQIIDALQDGKYHWVNTFELPMDDVETHLEEVFCRAQNTDRAWNDQIESRSTCVGDVIRVNGEFWLIAREGFAKLNVDPSTVTNSESKAKACKSCESKLHDKWRRKKRFFEWMRRVDLRAASASEAIKEFVIWK